MKKLLIAMLSILAIAACDNGGGGGGSDSQTAPKILDIRLEDFAFQSASHTQWSIDEFFYAKIIAYDPDLDMQTYYVDIVTPNHITFQLSGSLSPVPAPISPLEYVSERTPVKEFATDGTGVYTVCWFIVDTKGNESEDFCRDYTVTL